MQPRFGLGVLNKLSELEPAIQVLFFAFFMDRDEVEAHKN